MLKTVLAVFLAFTIAVVGGGWSAWYALEAQEGVGAVTIGQWTTYPDLGTAEADPYTQARAARRGALVLGRTEGVVFVARHDAAGELLLRECSYQVQGGIAAARFWTLFAADSQFTPIRTRNGALAALQSGSLVRGADNGFSIAVSPMAQPGNWLADAGSGPLYLVLTLYDSPAAGDLADSTLPLPTITKVGCDA